MSNVEQWLTRGDFFVCSQCWPLHRQFFTKGSGPQPVRDTHPRCRCIRREVETSELPGHIQSEIHRITKRALQKQFKGGKRGNADLRAELGRALATALDRERRRAATGVAIGVATTIGAGVIADELERRRRP